jgi:hypothetical protein
VKEKQSSTTSEVIQCFRFGEKRGRGNTHFGRGKEHVKRLLVLTHWCGVAASSRSWAASRLTRGVRQPVGPKGCLGRIMLWRSNMLSK